MKLRTQRLMPFLIVVAFTFISFFFILITQTIVRAAQPMVAAGWYHTVGLHTDGTVVAVGRNEHGQLNIGDWTDIVQVSLTPLLFTLLYTDKE